MPLILRATKIPAGRLTIAEMDGNFTYLQNLTLGVSQSIASLPKIPVGGTTSQVLAKASGADYDLVWVNQTGGAGGGSNGTSGVNGANGTSGINGANGTSGVNGANGTSGVNGANGTSGVNGANGTSGIDGANGTSGIDGANGTSGIDGANGTSGIDGANGTSGVNGANGTSGVNGANGTSGIDGANGTSGISRFYITNVYGSVNYTLGIQSVDVDTDLAYSAGDYIIVFYNSSNYMVSKVIAYNASNGLLQFDSVRVIGSGIIDGTHTVNLTGYPADNGTSGTSGERGAVGSTFNILGIFPNYSALTQTVGTMSSITPPNSFDSYILQDTSHVWVYGPTASMGLSPSVANSDGWVDMGAIEGPQGLSGTSGVNGANGESGTSGVNGESGTSGVDGMSGTSGVNGESGTSGVNGENGTSGVDGASGTSGVDGASGTSGVDGASGTSGVDGASGTSGVDGMSGTSGTSGISANLESIRNIFVLGTYSPPLGSTQSTGMAQLDFSSSTLSQYPLDSDEDSWQMVLPWDIQFLGVTYSDVYISSNSYITFGTSSQSKLAAPGMVSAPAIFIGSGDNSLQTLLEGYDPLDPNIYRIRFEGSTDTSGFFLGSTIVWEMLIDINSRDQIKIVVGTNLRNPGGVYGISDGTNWIEKFAAIPTYDEKTDKMQDCIDIYSIAESEPSYSDNLSSIKFVGPGVYRNLSGTTATINVDPLGQYGLGVNYNPPGFASINGQTVLSSTRLEFVLTTGKDETPLKVKPRGDLFLQPYNRNANQFGSGFNVSVVASNASQDALDMGDYDGGSIFITPGTPVGAGYPGDVNIGRVGSFIAMTGTIVANGSVGFTGTYSTGAGQVVTVESGIITGVA